MNYEINVSKEGAHYFATAERSLYTEGEAFILIKQFRELFKESEGYEISLCLCRKTSQSVKIPKDL